MVELLRPARGGFLRPFGCAWFIREFLMGQAPYGSTTVDSEVGACQSAIFFEYKTALLKATAMDKSTRVEEKKARREKRVINPDNIERLAEVAEPRDLFAAMLERITRLWLSPG